MKPGAAVPSLLDLEEEDAIANAINSKSTCHGRRHEATLFTNQRVKKKDLLSLANYSRLRHVSGDGAVVRALASHQRGPGSIAGSGIICGLSLLLLLVPAPRVFLRVLRFSSLNKNQHF